MDFYAVVELDNGEEAYVGFGLQVGGLRGVNWQGIWYLGRLANGAA